MQHQHVEVAHGTMVFLVLLGGRPRLDQHLSLGLGAGEGAGKSGEQGLATVGIATVGKDERGVRIDIFRLLCKGETPELSCQTHLKVCIV